MKGRVVPAGAAKGRRAQMDGESRTTSSERSQMLLRNFASFLRAPGFSQSEKIPKREIRCVVFCFPQLAEPELFHLRSGPITQEPACPQVGSCSAGVPVFPLSSSGA